MRIRLLQNADAVAFTDRLNAETETDWTNAPDPQTVVLFDRPTFGAAADVLKRTNPVFGGGRLQDSLHTEFGAKIAQNSGISIEAAEGPKMSIDAFYIQGQKIGLMLSSVEGEGNAFCRIWKKAAPKIYNMTLARCEPVFKSLHYTGPLSCECVIAKQKPHFVRWITYLQPHILWAIGPWLPVVLGTQALNGETIPYCWFCVVRLSAKLCFVSAQGDNLKHVKRQIRETVNSISVVGKSFTDNLDDLERQIYHLQREKFL